MPVDVVVPPLGATIDSLTLVAWYKQEGDYVEKDELLFAVETDKATLDIESPASGILRQISAEPGAEVASLSRIALICAHDETLASCAAPEQTNQIYNAGDPISVNSPRPSSRSSELRGRAFISPRAKRLAEETGLDWRRVKGTGPEGAIVERDIRLGADLAQSPVEESDVLHTTDDDVIETIPLTGIRGVTAARMAKSAAATAPVTLTTEVDATAFVNWRKKLAEKGVAATYNDLLLFLLSRALWEHPRMNASIDGKVIRVWRRINIGLAVEGEDGLRAPVVKDVDQKSLEEIALETRSLIDSVRKGRVRPEDLRGATFTLTNLGMLGIDAFTPLINLPECAILGVGRIKPQPAVLNDSVVIRQKMWLSLTFDHRLVNGAPAARFLQFLAKAIETPTFTV